MLKVGATPRYNRSRQIKDDIQVLVRRPDWSAIVSRELPFGEKATDRFEQALLEARSYLEFGSGSSSIHGSRCVKSLVSVESDARFLSAVQGLCVPAVDGQQFNFLHAAIGSTGAWGVPIFRRPTRDRTRKWINYPLAPWLALGLDYRADLILVDGRFRVACALGTVLLQPSEDWILLFDDYVSRPEYWGFEAFAKRVATHGRMAEFRPLPGVELGSARLAFDSYVRDWR